MDHNRYGKMYLPPADALVPQSQTLGADEPMKYSDYRFIENEILARTNGLKVNDKSPINIPLDILRTGGADVRSANKAVASPVASASFSSSSSSNQEDVAEADTEEGEEEVDEFWTSASTEDLLYWQNKLLPVACGVSNMGVVSPYYNRDGSRSPAASHRMKSSTSSCTTSSGLSGIKCWKQCVALSTVNCTDSLTQHAECYDKNTSTIVDGDIMCPHHTTCSLKCYNYTAEPTFSPTYKPTATPTYAPSFAPSLIPTATPTYLPTYAPTKAPTSSDSSCFSAFETVLLESGETKLITEVAIGDRILTASSSSSPATTTLAYSDVVFIPHKANRIRSSFLHLSTHAGKDIKMTPGHLLPAGDCSLPATSMPLRMASEVAVGMCVVTVDGSRNKGDQVATKDEVVSIDAVESEGIYSVVTANDGYVVVSGFVASPFAYVHWVPNTFYNIHRMAYKVVGSNSAVIAGILKGANVIAAFVADAYLSVF
jgi:hypothetical protein